MTRYTRPHFITTHPSIVVCDAPRATELLREPRTRAELSGFVSIANPASTARPSLALRDGLDGVAPEFLDTEDATLDGAPDLFEIERILHYDYAFHQPAYVGATLKPGRLLIHCAAGRRRSTAAAFTILCARLGPGLEAEAMTQLLSACERTPLPNMLMCSFADRLLGRNGALLQVAERQNEEPIDCGVDEGKPVTGTALLNGIRRGEL